MRRRRLPRALSRWFFSGFCVGLLFFLFFREKAVLSFLSGKEKKEPKKRNLIGEGDERKQSGGPPRGVCAAVGGVFFLFFQEKKRKNQRKETLSGWDLRGSNQATLPLHPLPVFPCGAFQKKSPAKYFLRGMQVPLTGGRSGIAQAGLWLSFLVLFSFSGKKRERKRTENRGRGARCYTRLTPRVTGSPLISQSLTKPSGAPAASESPRTPARISAP